MAKEKESYDYIAGKIESLKNNYPSLRARSDEYVFSALCVKAGFYKNPALILNDSDFADIIVDGQADGGADILLTDPNSESSDFVIGQAKFYKTISSEDVLNAMRKMADFYKDMQAGHYERVNAHVQSRFLTLNAEVGEESKIHFVFYTSAPKARIDKKRIERKFREQFTDSDAFEVSILFDADIAEEIKEAESRRPSVDYGKIQIDAAGNFLQYGDDAAIVNVSAFAIKQLYAEHNINLLSRNLRYHLGGKLDGEIKATISKEPASFWLKNNGITIICDDFVIDGREVKLWNFSIVNGGQTTYLLHKSKTIDAAHDFYLTCKIIKTVGETETEKSAFSLEIAKAANSQKAIKPADLRANTPEQVRFAQAMRAVGVFYQTKRGEEIPKAFRDAYLNTKLADIGKLCLAGIFQLPCTSRNKPSQLYLPKYYEPVFNGNAEQIANVCKELLYADYYFDKKFQPQFNRDNRNMPDAADKIPFASNARTICIAFTALAARYHQGNITDNDLTALTSTQADSAYKALRDLGEMKFLLPVKLYTDAYDATLDRLFEAIIEEGATAYSYARERDSNLAAANFLKNDKNYYDILKRRWSTLRRAIDKIFSVAQNINPLGGREA